MKTSEFDYRMDKPYSIVICLGMFSLFAYLAWNKLDNPYYVLRYKGHYFGVDASHYIMMGMLVFSIIGALIFAVVFFFVTMPRKVILSEDGFEMPASIWTRRAIKIKYDEILDFKITTYKKHESLSVLTNKGKLKILSSMFPNQDNYMYLSKCISRKKYIG